MCIFLYIQEQVNIIRKLEERITKAKQSYGFALHRFEAISDEIHERRRILHTSLSEMRGVGVGAESPIPRSPKLSKLMRKLSLDSSQSSIPLSHLIPFPWFYNRSKSVSAASSEKDECESIASIDTLDDNAIENLMLDKTLEAEFSDILETIESNKE